MFDRQALTGAKAQINRATLPPERDFISSYHEFSSSITWTSVKDRLRQIGMFAGHIGVGEMEKNLGYDLGAGSTKK